MKFKTPIQNILYVTILVFALAQGAHATEEKLQEIKAEIAALEEKIAEIENSGASGADVMANITTAENEITETKSSLSARESEIAEKEYLLSVYQSAFRVVTTLERGASLGNLTMPDGSTLQNVVFVGISGGAVQLQTSSGLKTLGVAQMPASLASSFQLPPQIAPLASKLEMIYSQKPEVAMTEADKETKSTMAKFSSGTTGASGESQPAKMTANGAKAEEAPEEAAEKGKYELIKERNDARLERIAAMRVQYSDLYAQVKKLKAERYEHQARFNAATIKKSKAQQDKVFGSIDSKLDVLNEKIRNLKNEMNQVRSDFE